jgi:hypothetical protein
MSDNNNNGHHPDEEAEITAERRELQRTLDQHSIENAFRTHNNPGAIHYIAEAGRDLNDMSMRIRIPRKRTEAYRLIVALAHHNAKAVEFEDTGAQAELKHFIALLVSENGQGRDELVRSITGEFNHGGIQAGGWKDKLMKAAGLNSQ